MTTPITAGSIWPSRLAYTASAIFCLASGGTNLIYGWNKGTDVATSLIWAAVSVGVSIVFTLSWPALIRCIEGRQWSRAMLVLIALLITGTYSLSAALGSASGGRHDAAALESTLQSARTRAQATYDKSTAELQVLKPTRPLSELEALVAAPAPCRVVVTMGSRQTVCSHAPKLLAELGVAKRRAELETRIEAARLELSAPTTRQANSDAQALAGYLGVLGLDVEADALNKILALLAVLVIELGGGASLAVGMALSARGHNHRELMAGQISSLAGSLPWPLPPPSAKANRQPAVKNGVLANETAPAGILPSTTTSGARERLLALLQSGQGVVRGCQAEIGSAIGVSRARVRQLLGELAAAGVIRVRTSSTGTVVSLTEPADVH